MNKFERLVAYALFLMPVLWAPASSFAQSPFDGTWRTNMDQSKVSPKPVVFSVNKGMYDCSSCSPKINVKADGRDRSVTGQTYDTISVREVGPKSIAVTTKKSGKTVSEQTRTVSEDGNTLTVKITYHLLNSDQPMSMEYNATRVGKAPTGANGTSGAWRNNKVKASENDLITTYKSSGDELSMSTPWGKSYTAKLDGKDSPVKGSYFYSSVSLRRIDARTIEEKYKRAGKVVEVDKISVSPDGKKMTVVVTNMLTGATSTYVAEKQ
jgi:GH15 family glucan-1,4-alpha-glucosidase